MGLVRILNVKHCHMNDFSSDPDPPPVVGVPSIMPLAALTGASDVLDMPVDPNEPTYCLCHQVSYGEMIGCDNQDVSIIWRILFK